MTEVPVAVGVGVGESEDGGEDPTLVTGPVVPSTGSVDVQAANDPIATITANHTAGPRRRRPTGRPAPSPVRGRMTT
jgi:hypothetical protein